MPAWGLGGDGAGKIHDKTAKNVLVPLLCLYFISNRLLDFVICS